MKLDSLLLVFLIALIAVAVYALFVIKAEGTACLASPLQYAINKTSESVGSDLQCTCNFDNNNYLPFTITKEGSKPIGGNVPMFSPPPIENYSNLLK